MTPCCTGERSNFGILESLSKMGFQLAHGQT